MNKAILFIAMVCMLMIGATANADYIVAYSTPKKAIDIDGLNGELSLMTTTDSNPTLVKVTDGEYVNGDCQSARVWAWNNAVKFKTGRAVEGDYKLNYQTCRVEVLKIVKTMHFCEGKNKRVFVAPGDSYESQDKSCLKKDRIWTPINLNAPLE